jgi:purine-binding chemotaxis protein CheW
MNPPQWLLNFSLDEQHYALYLSAVERVIPALEVTMLPQAPDIIKGVINLQGRVIPVADIRKRFGLEPRELMHTDQFIIARTVGRPVAIIADKVQEVIDYSVDNQIEAETIVPGLDYVKGIVKLSEGMVLIHDLDRFLSLDELQKLDRALEHIAKPSEGENDTASE